MATKTPGESFTLALKQKLELDGAEITLTSVIIESVVNPDGTSGEQNLTVQFSIVEGTASFEWSLPLPSNYQEYLTRHRLECTFQSSHFSFQVVEINLESFNEPLVKIVFTKH
jgi:hypothetical protein